MKDIIPSDKQIKANRHKPYMPTIKTLSDAPKFRNRKHKKYSASNKWKKFYGTKVWRDLREQKLFEQPLCERCLNQGKVVSADCVHHRCRFGQMPTEELQWKVFLDYDNLVSLCDKCHKDIHNGLTANEDIVWIE